MQVSGCFYFCVVFLVFLLQLLALFTNTPWLYLSFASCGNHSLQLFNSIVSIEITQENKNEQYVHWLAVILSFACENKNSSKLIQFTTIQCSTRAQEHKSTRAQEKEVDLIYICSKSNQINGNNLLISLDNWIWIVISASRFTARIQ